MGESEGEYERKKERARERARGFWGGGRTRRVGMNLTYLSITCAIVDSDRVPQLCGSTAPSTAGRNVERVSG